MATETFYATSHITGTILNPNNALDNTPTTWAGDVNQVISATSRYAIGDPVNPLTSGYTTHSIAVVARKGTNTGTPTMSVNLYENGSLVKSLVGTTNITSTTGQTLSGTFTTAEITNRANIEVEVVISGTGGNAATRNTVQVSHFTMVVDTTAAAPIVERTGSISGAATLSGTGQRRAERTASISGTSTLSGDSQKIRSRTGSISGTSTLTGDGENVSSYFGPFSDPVTFTLTELNESEWGTANTVLEEPVLPSEWGKANATLTPYPYIHPFSDPVTFVLASAPTLKRWNGSEWVSAVLKHGAGWPTVNFNNF